MNTDSNTRNAIARFADCHEGIISQLDTLGELDTLLAAAARARAIAQAAVKFFDEMITEHHEDEERELFPTVCKYAAAGDERQAVQELVDRLVADHRVLEKEWNAIKPQLARIAAGDAIRIDAASIGRLVSGYKSHAHFEETRFLPLAETILGRDSAELARLGYALHIRHAHRKTTPFT